VQLLALQTPLIHILEVVLEPIHKILQDISLALVPVRSFYVPPAIVALLALDHLPFNALQEPTPPQGNPPAHPAGLEPIPLPALQAVGRVIQAHTR